MSDITTTADVAVIGLGAMGAAALYQLAKRGARVIGLDRFAPPHDRGSSHGETRITRQAVGEGTLYAPLVLRSHAIWRDLEAATGKALLHACGGLIIGPAGPDASHHGKPDFVRRTVAAAERFGIAHEVLDRADLARRFPQFTGLGETDMACFEPGAGYLHPERCIAAQLAEAERAGAVIGSGVACVAVKQRDGIVRIETDGGVIEAPRVVVTAGAWTAPLLGPPFDRLLRVTRQVLHWFPLERPDDYRSGRFPVFIRMHGAGDSAYFYGFPSTDGATAKIATEQYQHAATADTLDRSVSSEEQDAMVRNHIQGRMAGVQPHAVRSSVCLYTNTPDSDFLIDAHPDMDRVLAVSACSGHGFKHSAAIGEAVAELVLTGRSAIDLSAFGLARFG
ncbi:MAG: N-methyl-L-tryptophan oxidase [Acetobacteraceae bacterium]